MHVSYSASNEACSPAVFTCTWYSASRLPEARGRACAGAASASYASCRSDSLYIYIDYTQPLSVHIFRIQLLRGTDKTYRAPRHGVLFVCPAAWTACQCLMAMQIWILAVIIRIVTMILAMISTAMTSAMTKSSASFATKTPNE